MNKKVYEVVEEKIQGVFQYDKVVAEKLKTRLEESFPERTYLIREQNEDEDSFIMKSEEDEQ